MKNQTHPVTDMNPPRPNLFWNLAGEIEAKTLPEIYSRPPGLGQERAAPVA
jgi:hypothetical protein